MGGFRPTPQVSSKFNVAGRLTGTSSCGAHTGPTCKSRRRSHATLGRLKTSATFPVLLQRGLAALGAKREGKFIQVKVPTVKKEGQEEASEEVVGLIVRNRSPTEEFTGNQIKDGAIVIYLTDLEVHPLLVGEKSKEEQAVKVVDEVADPGTTAAC